jgi:hypothetical protein
MDIVKKFLSVFLSGSLALSASALTNDQTTATSDNEMVAYLFTYFNSNAPEDEQICYAISDDGYNYTPLNHGLPVISSDTIALTQCVRDPHILRCEDGKTFYMVCTDMRSQLGWSSNRGIVLLKSTDLIHWQHSTVNFPTRYTKTWKNVIRVWAPETIYDRQAGKYMVFYSLRTSDPGSFDRIYYQYANSDFTDLEGEPRWLFDARNATIDGDIVYNEADQLYHLFYKQESGRGIYQAVAKNLTDRWQMIDGHVEQTEEAVEGVGVCKALDGKSWIIMYDCYSNGHYQFCRSEDLKTFQFVQNTETKGKFTPRHGTIIPITLAEKERLLKEYGNYKQPILPGFHADPEVLYSNKTKKYYIYSTTDGTPGWGGHDFSVFSSTNLIDWTDEGKMLDVKSDQVSWASGNAWAPAIVEVKQKGGTYKYYFYYSAHNPQTRRKEIGVAVSDSPTGPFVDSGAPIITDADRPEGAQEGQAIDVDVFRDPKTGKHYLYWGNGFMAGAELNDDLCSVKKETITLLTPEGGTLDTWAFREGAYVFYRKGRYYFLWSVDDTGSPNYHVCYGTAKSPLGPITLDENSYRVIEQRPDDKIYGTAHNSILQIPGHDEWYIVYHRINRNYVDFGNGIPGTHREVCIDRLTFDKPGRIIPVIPTLDGPEPLK